MDVSKFIPSCHLKVAFALQWGAIFASLIGRLNERTAIHYVSVYFQCLAVLKADYGVDHLLQIRHMHGDNAQREFAEFCPIVNPHIDCTDARLSKSRKCRNLF